MLRLLLEHDASCMRPEYALWEHHGLEYYIEHPENIIQKKYKYLKEEVTPSITPKIPQLLHHIWLTHPNSSREISPENIKQIIKNKELFYSSDYQWTHILWVNDIDLIQAIENVAHNISPHRPSYLNANQHIGSRTVATTSMSFMHFIQTMKRGIPR